MNQTDDVKKIYLDNFTLFENSLNGQKEEKFHKLRKNAIELFAEQNFPTSKDEEWRFTNIAPILKHNFKTAVKATVLKPRDISKFIIDDVDAELLVFVNGKFSKELSNTEHLPKGTIIGSTAEIIKTNYELAEKYIFKSARPETGIFTALNNAFTEDGVFIYIPAGKIIEKPVLILHIASSKEEQLIIQPRNIIAAAESSQVKIIENYVSLDNGVYFTNCVTEVFCGSNAVVEHIKLQNESVNSYHISTTDINLEKQSNYSSYNISIGSSICRNNINAKFNAEWSECTLNGLYLTNDTQLIDNHTMIDHAVPNCISHELYKGVLDGKSRAVFNGKVMVRKDAQKTNAFQQNKTILLSDDALIDTKPQLEIFADDVKCSHGATIGQLDDDSMFYLRSRGIGFEQARTILIYAFASDVVHSIKINPLKEYLEKLLAERLMR